MTYDEVKHEVLKQLTPVVGSRVWQGTEHWVVERVLDGEAYLRGTNYGLIVRVSELWPLHKHELRPLVESEWPRVVNLQPYLEAAHKRYLRRHSQQ